MKFGWVGGSTTGFIQALETWARPKCWPPRVCWCSTSNARKSTSAISWATQTSTLSQTSTTQTVQFMDVGTQLRLRPFVSSDGRIRHGDPPRTQFGEIDSNGIPQTNTSQVTTNVMIPDGATIVIGGLIDTEVNTDWAGIPFLSRIPLLGYLFRNTIDDTTKKELIVILTPHIWRPECPEGLNYLGRPRCLGLEPRVGQIPHEEQRDGPSLLEIPPPQPWFRRTIPCIPAPVRPSLHRNRGRNSRPIPDRRLGAPVSFSDRGPCAAEPAGSGTQPLRPGELNHRAAMAPRRPIPVLAPLFRQKIAFDSLKFLT